ncbi:MAG: hypothetical protein JNK05_11980 [Myxococcales bacterium]|nr:hypothetical protein [Myxococcales bacterium]
MVSPLARAGAVEHELRGPSVWSESTALSVVETAPSESTDIATITRRGVAAKFVHPALRMGRNAFGP